MCELASMSPVDDAWRMPDGLWQCIEPLLPQEHPHPKGGCPYAPACQCMDGIFYVLRTGCQWKALPKGFAAPSTVHLRFQQWRTAGVFERVWQEGLIEYDACHGLDWEWQAMDGAMTKAPLGGKGTGPNPTDRGKSGTNQGASWRRVMGFPSGQPWMERTGTI